MSKTITITLNTPVNIDTLEQRAKTMRLPKRKLTEIMQVVPCPECDSFMTGKQLGYDREQEVIRYSWQCDTCSCLVCERDIPTSCIRVIRWSYKHGKYEVRGEDANHTTRQYIRQDANRGREDQGSTTA